MKLSQRFWRGLVFLLLIAALCGGMVLPVSAISAAPLMQAAALSVVINEIGWGGTPASGTHEWIELYNPGGVDIPLTGWTLVSTTDNTPSIPLSGTIAAGGYYLLERNEAAISDMTANLIYTGALSNTAETLELRDNTSTLIDTANLGGASWFAGSAGPNFYSMERINVVADSPTAWISNNGAVKNGLDSSSPTSFPINGTPGQQNSATLALTATVTPTITNTPTITFTPTQTLTPTITSTATLTFTPIGSMRVIINEVAWSGTLASPDDEWIELYNPGSNIVDLTGWTLGVDSSNITLIGSLAGGGYFLLERGDDFTVSDAIANQIYTGNALSNNGGTLRLRDPSNNLIDSANINGGPWPAGTTSGGTVLNYNSMERIVTGGIPRPESDTAWISNVQSSTWTKHDANNAIIRGTPGYGNWAQTVTPTSSPTPTATRPRTATPRPSPTRTATFPPPPPLVAINEFVPRPGHDWNNDGVVNVEDEYVELINHGTIDVNLGGYSLDDEVNIGSSPYSLPSITISPGERIVFYGRETGLLLSDGGDGVRLLMPNGQLGDAYNYRLVRFPDQSFCRLPDNGGADDWSTNCFPTPGLQNALSGSSASPPNLPDAESQCPIADTLPIDFILAECPPFGNNIWRSSYWDETGWYDEKYLPESPGKWPVFAD